VLPPGVSKHTAVFYAKLAEVKAKRSAVLASADVGYDE
jgi:hypothetical protein